MFESGLRAGFLVVLFAVQTVGCSDGDESDDDEQESGTCINDMYNYCAELKGDSMLIESEMLSCEDAGGMWIAFEPCPTADLIACCHWNYSGNDVRDCYYTGYDTIAEVEENCTEGLHGTWTPMGR